MNLFENEKLLFKKKKIRSYGPSESYEYRPKINIHTYTLYNLRRFTGCPEAQVKNLCILSSQLH